MRGYFGAVFVNFFGEPEELGPDFQAVFFRGSEIYIETDFIIFHKKVDSAA
jgi:hypothetical protein